MSNNTYTIEPLLAQRKGLIFASEPKISVSMARILHLVNIAGDVTAPHFTADTAPLKDGAVFKAVDGQAYYRPQLRVAQREGMTPGPDVRFLKDADDQMHLQMRLEEAPQPTLPSEAAPLHVRVQSIILQWEENGQVRQRVFDQPSVIGSGQRPSPTHPNFSIQASARLNSAEVQPLYYALSQYPAKTQLVVKLTYGYWTDTAPPAGGLTFPPLLEHLDLEPLLDPGIPPPIGLPDEVPIPLGIGPTIETDTHADMLAKLESATVVDLEPVAEPPVAIFSPAEPIAQPDMELAELRELPDFEPVEMVWLQPHELLNLKSLNRFWERHPNWADLIERAEDKRKDDPNFHLGQLTRSLAFIFDSTLAMNKPIYEALTGRPGLAETWTDTSFGSIRVMPQMNTVYRLPDEVRLAYHPELGAPYMVPSLYRDAQDNIRVRVQLGAIPWYDPEQIVQLRDYLRAWSDGTFVAPQVVVGGYEAATFTLTSAFPEFLTALASAENKISLADGFTITLDLSLEYYRLLAELLTGAVGLTGEVTVTLETKAAGPGGAPQPVTRLVPMRLNFDDLGPLPITYGVADAAVSPRQVQLRNRAPEAVSVGGCLARLLQLDTNSVVPLDAFEAKTDETQFPAMMPAQGELQVAVQPKDEAKAQFWNAIQVELVGLALTQLPKQVLDRVHEVAAVGSLQWTVTVRCPTFEQPLPPPLQTLYALRVKIVQQGFEPQVVLIQPAEVAKTVTLQRKLRDIVSEEATGLAMFKYQVQNVYHDHEGKWSDERPVEGTDLLVFPNPIAND